MSDGTARRPVGATGVELSAVAFGTSGLGSMPDTYGYAVDEARARATLDAILDGPPCTIDTSNNYGAGRSEERIGAALRDRGGLPAGFTISTKLDRDPETGRFDGDRARRSLEESLGRLGVDRIDVLHLHDPEHARDLGEITEALMRMREEGVARAVGLAMGRVDIMLPLLADWDFDALVTHNRWTLLNRNAGPVLDAAAQKGIAVMNAAPYASGVLAKGSANAPRIAYQEASEAQLEPVRRIEAICARHGVPVAAAALRFSMDDPRVASTIVGVTRPERVAETLALAATPIPQALWDELAEVPFGTEDPEATRDYRAG
jgi:D-threo-aldose 1-dehydrogenase